MTDILAAITEQASQNSLLEICAVVLGVAYLLLAMRESILCWYAAFVSTSIFLWVFWDVNLYMESGLQVFYLVMAVYGWQQWRKQSIAASGSQPNSKDNTESSSLPISTWSLTTHGCVIVAVIVLSLATGYSLDRFTDAQLPFLDSLTTWGAIVTTYMVTKKVLENWIYWFFIDAVSIYLYLDRGLYFTALLFALYVIIVIFGYLTWSRRYSQQTAS